PTTGTLINRHLDRHLDALHGRYFSGTIEDARWRGFLPACPPEAGSCTPACTPFGKTSFASSGGRSGQKGRGSDHIESLHRPVRLKQGELLLPLLGAVRATEVAMS